MGQHCGRHSARGKRDSPFRADFGLTGKEVKLVGRHPGGGKLSRIEHVLEYVSSHRYANNAPPQAVVLHIGGNDADHSTFNMEQYITDMGSLLNFLVFTLKVSRVVVCSVFPRLCRSGESSYEIKRKMINERVLSLISLPRFRPFCYFFRFEEHRFVARLWDDDGVHLSAGGMCQYYHQMRRALMCCDSLPFRPSPLEPLPRMVQRPRPPRSLPGRYRYQPYQR